MSTQRNEELVFAALADQVRRQILDTLATHGECSAGFISDQVHSVGRTTVSAHLKALKTSGMIVERRDGRSRLFSIDPAGPAHDALVFLRDVLERALTGGMAQSKRYETAESEANAATPVYRHG